MKRFLSKKYINCNPQQYFRKSKLSGFVCPLCSGGAGTKADGLKLEPEDKTRTQYKCLSCGESGDVLHFIGKEYGISDQKELLKKAYEIFCVLEESPSDERNPGGKNLKAVSAEDRQEYLKNMQSFLNRINESINK
jgi:hypothetical protein